MKKYELKVRVGIAHNVKKMLAVKDIESLFYKVEEIFLEVCDIHIKFVIHDIKEWDTKRVKKLQQSKDFNDLCKNYYPFKDALGYMLYNDLRAWLVGLYYMLGDFKIDLLVGLCFTLPGRWNRLNGIGSDTLRTCICALKKYESTLPYILTHEMLHVLKVNHEDNDVNSIMYHNVGQLLVESPDIIDFLSLDKERKQKAKYTLENIVKKRKKGG